MFLFLLRAYVGYICGVNTSDWSRGYDIGYEHGRKEREKHEHIDKGHGNT